MRVTAARRASGSSSRPRSRRRVISPGESSVMRKTPEEHQGIWLGLSPERVRKSTRGGRALPNPRSHLTEEYLTMQQTRRVQLSVEQLEERTVPAYFPIGAAGVNLQPTGVYYDVSSPSQEVTVDVALTRK